jgi:hypothetical protein
VKKPRISEKQFMAQVVQFARLNRWLVYHTHDSRRSVPGFPDLCMVHPERKRLLFAELKVGANRPTDEQHEWMLALSQSGARAVLWYPEDWPEIESTLSQ